MNRDMMYFAKEAVENGISIDLKLENGEVVAYFENGFYDEHRTKLIEDEDLGVCLSVEGDDGFVRHFIREFSDIVELSFIAWGRSSAESLGTETYYGAKGFVVRAPKKWGALYELYDYNCHGYF